VPFLGERVELREQRRLQCPPPPPALEPTCELLGAAAVGQADLLHPRLSPDPGRLLRIDRDEDARVSAGRKMTEHAAVEAVLDLGDEMEHVVRQPLVVAGRRPDEQVGRPVTTDVDVVAALLLREPDLH
jgi:hypothetical protein